MPRIAYVNGQYVPHHAAGIAIEDRGYQFADGVYEVIAIAGGEVVDMDPHMARLKNSLAGLEINLPISEAALRMAMLRVARLNRVQFGILYLQISRGVAPRDHAWAEGLRPSLVMTCRSVPMGKMAALAEKGVSVKTMPEDRWARPDIKTISLLPNVLAKQAARSGGDYEAWFVDGDGYVTEGASTNAWIVEGDGTLVTRPLSRAILPGIARSILLEVAARDGIPVREEAFTPEQAKGAREAFITSTGGLVPVTAIDGDVVANGAPGGLSLQLAAAYQQHMADQTANPEATMRGLQGQA